MAAVLDFLFVTKIFKMKHLLFLFLPLFGIAQQTSYVCQGNLPKNFSIDCAGEGWVFEWTSPSAVVTSGQSVDADAEGVWTWKCTSESCVNTGTHELIVEEDPTESIVIVANNTCSGSSQSISATGVPEGYTYIWNFGSGSVPSTSITSSTNVVYNTSGTKTITLSIIKNMEAEEYGCSDICSWLITDTIEIISLPGFSTCN